MAALSKDQTIGIVGVGTMGSGIAQVAAAAGHPVLLADAVEGQAERAKERIAVELQKRVEKGRLDPGERTVILSKISPSGLAGFGQCALVLEAVAEDLEVKRSLFRELEQIVPESCILATNTSTLSVTEIASAVRAPGRCVGMHFFNPAAVMPLVEVVSGYSTEPSVARTIFDTAVAWGKTPVRAKSSPGFIVNKGARPFYGEPLRFFEEGGADAVTIDTLMRAAGFKMGPLELIDLIGLDVNLAASRSMWQAYYGEPRYKPSWAVEERVAAGHLGRKSGKGFYDYGAEKQPEPKFMTKGALQSPVDAAGNPICESLLSRLSGAGVNLLRGTQDLWAGSFYVNNIRISMVNSPLEPNVGDDWAIFDLSLNYGGCNALAVTGTDKGVCTAADLFGMAGISVARVANLPGLLVARTLAMLINEAVDSLQRGVATREDIDLAMQAGLSFPGGPFSWLEQLGPQYVRYLLSSLQTVYGEERYRANIHLHRLAEEQNA